MTSPAFAAPETLARTARQMIDAGRLQAARPLVAALRRIGTDPSTLAGLQARLLEREARIPEAIETLDEAVAASPDDVALLLHRGELRLQREDVPGGADDAARAVILDRGNPHALSLLGIALVRAGRGDDAVTCLADAVARDPSHSGYRRALAEAEELAGHPDRAAFTLAEAIARAPDVVDLRVAAVMLATRQGDFVEAARVAGAACKAGTVDGRVFGLLGHALSSLGRHDAAAEAYTEALKLAPEDPYVRHLVGAAGQVSEARRADPAYVQTVFDGYAPRFERHLFDLGYRIPGVVRAALLARTPPAALRDVLDLGCGTGLIGVVLSDLPIGRLVGIDISPLMLEQAAAKGVYAELRCADIEAALDADAAQWDLIVAADVLIYFGDLAPVLDRVAARLRPGGLFMLSLETAIAPCAEPGSDAVGEPRGWGLSGQARYVHRPEYVGACAAAAGLSLLSLADEPIRFEAGVAAPGLFAVLGRRA